MESYGRAEVARLLRVDPRKLEGWVARGVLKPVEPEPGTGNPHRFTLPEIIRAAILLETQEGMGPRFIKPGSLASLLHDHLSDATLTNECRHAERTPWTPRTPSGGKRYPVGHPDDLILHIFRGWEEDNEQVPRRSRKLTITETTRKTEHVLPGSYAVLRIEVGPIVRTLQYRLSQSRSA